MSYRALIVGDRNISSEIAGLLEVEGFKGLRRARTGREALEAARAETPDVVIMEIDLPDEDPVAVAREMLVMRPVPILVHASYSQLENIREAEENGVSAHLFRPVTKETLLAAIELGVSRFKQCQTLHAEIGNCQEALRVRKLVERAKGILMKRNSLTEEEAFMRLQKLSRNNNITMEKVAESIITANEII